MLLHMLALDDMIAASRSRSRSSKRGSTSIDSSVPKGRRSKTLPPTASGVRIRFRGRARPSVFCSQRDAARENRCVEIGYFSRMLRTTPEERRFVKPKELYLSTIKRGTIADHDVYAGERTQARH